MYTQKEVSDMCGVKSRTLDSYLNYIRGPYPDFVKDGIFKIDDLSLFLIFSYEANKSRDLSYALAKFRVALAQRELENHPCYKKLEAKEQEKIK